MSRRPLLLPVIIFLMSGCTKVNIPLIPPDNIVVLDSKSVSDSTWHPTFEQVNKGISAINRFLLKPGKLNEWQMGEIGKIRSNFKKYNVQAVGIIENGRKLIWYNFFPHAELKNFSPGWKKEVLIVMDGGFWFWQIVYDIGTDRCLDFRSNGYA